MKDTLYFASQAGILYAVDLATGKPLWNKTIGGKIYSDLVLSGDKILIAPLEFDAALVAVDFQGNNQLVFYPGEEIATGQKQSCFRRQNFLRKIWILALFGT